MSSPLTSLCQIITSGISKIDSTYASRGATFPSLDEPFQPPPFNDPALELQIKLVVAAAHQLIASLYPPASTILDGASAVSLCMITGRYILTRHIFEPGIYNSLTGRCDRRKCRRSAT